MNNIKSYVLIFLCTFSVTTMANTSSDYPNPFAGANLSDDTTRYDVVAMAFSNAEAVDPEEVVGWKSGRCYHLERPNKPRNALLAVKQDAEGNYKAAFLNRRSGGQRWYDAPMDTVVKESVQTIVDKTHKRTNPLMQENGSLVRYHTYTTRSLRKGTIGNDEFIVEEKVGMSDPAFPSVDTYCYYLSANVK